MNCYENEYFNACSAYVLSVWFEKNPEMVSADPSKMEEAKTWTVYFILLCFLFDATVIFKIILCWISKLCMAKSFNFISTLFFMGFSKL